MVAYYLRGHNGLTYEVTFIVLGVPNKPKRNDYLPTIPRVGERVFLYETQGIGYIVKTVNWFTFRRVIEVHLEV